MSLPWFARRLAAGMLLLALALAGAHAADSAAAGQQQAMEALKRAVEAVVGVEVTATDGARSAETLGRHRSGSGVVIGADGLILTIGYLIVEAETIQISTADRRVLPARAVAYDLATGFGLLRPLLPIGGLEPVALGTVADLPANAPLLVAVGGEDGGVAIIQHLSTRPFSGYWEYHIETALFTAPPIGGHSGAPVFNQRGELLGVGSLFVLDALGGGRRVPGNMFVPVDLLRPILAELQRTGTTRSSHRPWLGINSAEHDGRVQIVSVGRGSPASVAGLGEGDVVLAIDGQTVSTLEALYKKRGPGRSRNRTCCSRCCAVPRSGRCG